MEWMKVSRGPAPRLWMDTHYRVEIMERADGVCIITHRKSGRVVGPVPNLAQAKTDAEHLVKIFSGIL